MKILLTGKNGQVGWELNRSLLPLGEVIAFGRHEFDLSEPERLRKVIRDHRPDVIVNAAAYTSVDKAEEEEDLAAKINGIAPAVLAEEAEKLNALLIHYSTDYVFDGTNKVPYTELDKPNPVNAYGRSKLAGELAVQSSGCDFLIFRTSWVYASHGANFAKTMLRLAKERETINVVDDQHGAPTSAELIADITALILYRVQTIDDTGLKYRGIYNLSPYGHTTWYGYARYILELAQSNGVSLKARFDTLKPVPTSAYPLPATRPKNSVLNTTKLINTFNLSLPDWRIQVRRMLEEIVV